MKNEIFDKVDEKMKEILMFLDELSIISKKYETTLKLENINKIHSELDVMNNKITNNFLTILEVLINEIIDAEEDYTSVRSSIKARNPVGAIQLVSKKILTEDNNSWLICDGKTYKSEEYPALHILYLSNDFKNTSNTFKVPNLDSLKENNEEYAYVIYAK